MSIEDTINQDLLSSANKLIEAIGKEYTSRPIDADQAAVAYARLQAAVQRANRDLEQAVRQPLKATLGDLILSGRKQGR